MTPIAPIDMAHAPQGIGADPWALIGEVTGYRYYRKPDDSYPIVLQLEGEGAATALRALARRRGWTVPGIYTKELEQFPRSAAFATATLDRGAYEQLLQGTVKVIRTWSLQLPVIPERPRPGGYTALPQNQPRARALQDVPPGPALFGVIDSGCPFARSDLLPGGASRVVALWDQDSKSVFSDDSIEPACRAGKPPDLGYGGEVSASQLEAWCKKFRDGAATLDEAACYRMAGYRLLGEQFQHGAVVLSLLAGPSRIEPRHPSDPDTPPDWSADEQSPAARAGIVFVQLSQDSIEDSSSASLPRAVLDGLRYIVDVARDQRCSRLVINVSDGTSRSAHDGRSIIELAMQALIADLAEQTPPLPLDLVLAAGNSFGEMRHAVLALDGVETEPGVTMLLPAGSEAPSFVTVVVPPDTPGLQLAVVPPGYATMEEPWVDIGSDDPGSLRFWPDPDHAMAWIATVRPRPRESRIVALSWAPTASFEPDRFLATAGLWLIKIRRKPGSPAIETRPVELWISRGQTNPGALDRARQPHFVDTDGGYDPCRALRSCEDDPPKPLSPIRRHGTLNGIATMAPGPGITVVGSRMIREDRPSLYSSEGPAPQRPQGPDCLRPTDFSRTLAGVRATGVYSGCVVRAEGTSFAAPQVARELMNGSVGPKALAKRPKRGCC